MSYEEFWYKDKKLFYAYQKAYHRNLYSNAFIIGQHIDLVVYNQLNNIANGILGGFKKGAKPLTYLEEPIDPFKKEQQPKTKEDLEISYRELALEQSNWLKQRHNKEN